jgi:predicted MFS family arabinose efflux permease
LAALAVSAVSTAAMALPVGFTAFLSLRFAGGFASAFVLVFASALVLQRLAGAGRSGLLAVHFAGVGLGITLSALLTWGVTEWGGDWRAMWLGGGLLSLLAWLAVPVLLPTSAGRADETPSGEAPRRVWPLITAYGLFGFGYIITATFIVDITRASPVLAALEPVVWLVFGLAAIPSVAAWTMAARRWGVTNTFAIACLVEAVGVAASVLWLDAIGILFAAAILGGTFVGLTALGMIAARELAPRNAGRLLALMTAAFGFGQIVGPLIAGFGHDLTGSYIAPSLIAAAGLCLAALLARSRRIAPAVSAG